MSASVRQRLLNLAKARQEDFNDLLVSYALERLIYRLSVSEHADQFVLKGALLFQLWFDVPQRRTRDADFLGMGSAEPQRLVEGLSDQFMQDRQSNWTAFVGRNEVQTPPFQEVVDFLRKQGMALLHAARNVKNQHCREQA